MSSKKNYIIGFLLIVIGILAGSLATFYVADKKLSDRAEVRFTEISKSNSQEDGAVSGFVEGRPPFNTVAKQATETVVFIESLIQLDKKGMPDDENHDFSDKFWDDILPSRKVQTAGSGVLISSDGYILTNNHVVEGADRDIKVTLKNKKAYRARIVGTDPNTDLAVLKIDGSNFAHATIGNSDKVEVGDWVLAVGNPFRLRSTVTAGIVSALSRQVQIINESLSIESFIQTDAAINRGNSGGALVNKEGDLIGINTAIATETGNYQGYGFAVPVNLAIKVAEDIIQYGEVKRALLGVTINAIDYERATYLGMDEVRGVEVAGVAETGAAQEFGIRAGDVILKVNGVKTDEVSILQERVALQRPGDKTTLEIWRDGETKKIDVILKGVEQTQMTAVVQSEDEPETLDLDEFELDSSSLPSLKIDSGYEVVELPGAADFGQYDLIILNVKEKSDAWKKGLRAGHEIIKINGKPVDTLNQLKDIVNYSSVSYELLVEDKDGRRRTVQF